MPEWMSTLPRDPGGLASWGAHLVLSGELAAAAVCFELALTATPREGRYAAALASVEQRLGRTRDAIAHYAQAIELGVDDVQVWTNLAELHIDTLDLRAASAALERAIACDPRGQHPAGMRARALIQKALQAVRA